MSGMRQARAAAATAAATFGVRATVQVARCSVYMRTVYVYYCECGRCRTIVIVEWLRVGRCGKRLAGLAGVEL